MICESEIDRNATPWFSAFSELRKNYRGSNSSLKEKIARIPEQTGISRSERFNIIGEIKYSIADVAAEAMSFRLDHENIESSLPRFTKELEVAMRPCLDSDGMLKARIISCGIVGFRDS